MVIVGMAGAALACGGTGLPALDDPKAMRQSGSVLLPGAGPGDAAGRHPTASPSQDPDADAKYPGQAQCPNGDYQLCIDGGPGGFTISGRRFSGHANAILLRNVSNVTISENTFRNLSGPTGYGAVHVKNSSDIVIEKNVFSGLRNAGMMHGVYLVRTSRASVTGNRFSSITGDPVRMRDGTRGTTVSGNIFTRSGTYAMFSEWGRLDQGERCGRGNTFGNNKHGTGYHGRRIPLIKRGGRGGGSTGLPLTWGHCPSSSLVNMGGNTKLPPTG